MKLSEKLRKILKDIKRMRRTGALLKTGADVMLVCEIEAVIEEYEQLESENAALKREKERLRDRFELIRETVNTPDGKMTVLELFTQLDRACNDILEGK